MLCISQLFVYPIKGLGGVALSSAKLTDRGIQYDRRWMLIDENNRFLSQRELHELSLFQVKIDEEQLEVTHKKNNNKLFIPLEPTAKEEISVTIWRDSCLAEAVSLEADEWFSEAL